MSSLPDTCEVICSSPNIFTDRNEANNEKLINAVHMRHNLWHQRSHDYGNRTLKVKLWEDVATEMNQRVADVKSRWKLLKDSFSREFRNMIKSGLSSSKWAHFDQMSFLLKGKNKLLLPRENCSTEMDSGYLSHSLFEVDFETQNTSSNSCENEFCENSHIATDEEQTLTPRKKSRKTNRRADSETQNTTSNSCENEFFENSHIATDEEQTLTPRKKSRKTYRRADSETQNTSSNICENEFFENSHIATDEERTLTPTKKRRKTNHLPLNCGAGTSGMSLPADLDESASSRTDNGNEDYYFLMSLLPTFEQLSPKQKMLVKIKLMQDVYEATFGDKSSDFNHNRYEFATDFDYMP